MNDKPQSDVLQEKRIPLRCGKGSYYCMSLCKCTIDNWHTVNAVALSW